MRLLRSLHGRLTFAYATAMLVGLCVFASVSAFFLLQLSANVLDTRLRTTAQALTAIATDAGPQLTLTAKERLEFQRVVKQLDAALYRPDGSIVITTAISVPGAIAEFGEQSRRLYPAREVRTPDDLVHVVASPVLVADRKVGTVVVWGSADSLEDFKRDMLLVFGVAIPVIVGVGVFAAWFVTRRGLTPLRAIAGLATDIEAHDLSRRLRPASELDELGSLSATFDRMLDRLEAAFDRQRRFTADASHELRAPLAVIRAEADLALRRSRTAEEYRYALESIASESSRIEELVADLLALARAESAHPQAVAATDLAPLVTDAIRRFAPIARSRDVRVAVDLAEEAQVLGDALALNRIPLVLLDNALKFARSGGEIGVTLARTDGRVRLAIHDDGSGFSREGLARATERFWRDDSVRGRGGSGLGLSIVNAIVQQYGGSLVIRNAPAGGGEVIVEFPAASE
jgi:signal transduction histidine kinase